MPKKNFPDHEPQDNPKGGVVRRGYDYIRKRWEDENRPGLFEFHYYYIPAAIGATLVWGGMGIGVVDGVVGTHIADDLANIEITPDSSWLTQLGESYLQCEGIYGGGEGPYKCTVFRHLLGGTNE